jgi:hypothetical protein
MPRPAEAPLRKLMVIFKLLPADDVIVARVGVDFL